MSIHDTAKKSYKSRLPKKNLPDIIKHHDFKIYVTMTAALAVGGYLGALSKINAESLH